MTHIRDNKIIKVIQTKYPRGLARLTENEDALVVCWFDIVKVLLYLAFVWACLSPFIDAVYLYMSNAAAVNSTFYTDIDYEANDDLYNFWHFIPLIGFGLVIFYAINYANVKRDQ